jgi:hypothetical protein
MMKRYRITGIPKKEHMVNDNYRYPGFIWEANRIMYETPEQEPLSEKILKEHYLRHNQDVQRYFKFREDLLVINLKESSSYQKFCDFLGHTPQYADFPWLNKSSEFIKRQ